MTKQQTRSTGALIGFILSLLLALVAAPAAAQISATKMWRTSWTPYSVCNIQPSGDGIAESPQAACSEDAWCEGFTVVNQTDTTADCQSGANGVLWRVNAFYQCPANSTVSGTQCVCNQGYTRRDQVCVPAVERVSTRKQPPKCQTCPATCESCPAFGDPIYPLTGAKKERFSTNLRIGGVSLVLMYDSTSKTPANTEESGASFPQGTVWGELWSSTFHRRLHVAPGQRAANLLRADGSLANFTGTGSGAFSGETGNPHQLASTGSGYRFTDVHTGSQELFDTAGNLVTIADATGVTLNFTYAAGLLDRVEATDGRRISFVYTDGRVTHIVGPDGARISVGYDTAGNLATLTWPDAKTYRFVYENLSAPWALTGKIDENNARYETTTYDNEGRAVETELAGGVDRFSVSYGEAPRRVINETFDAANNVVYRTHEWQAPQGTVVTLPGGLQTTLQSSVVSGMAVLTAQEQPPGSGTPAAAKALVYDSAGNVQQADSFDGSRKCYLHDSAGRELMRVEGLTSATTCESALQTGAALPGSARAITTTWHPDFQKPVQISERFQRTSFVYHGQVDPTTGTVANCTPAGPMPNGKPLPLICREVRQALLSGGGVDAAVPAKVMSYTYDAAGRPLTVTDPNGRLSSRAYYSTNNFDADPEMDKVVLLLHGNAGGSSTFVDSSQQPKVVAATSPGPTVSTAQSKFGGASLAINGTGTLRAGPSADWNITSSDDFTIELWFYRTSGAGTNGTFVALDGSNGWDFFWWSNNKAAVWCSSAGTFMQSASTLSLNRWYHYALSKKGSTLRLFIDGNLEATSTNSCGSTATATNLAIGDYFGSERFNGYLDDIRITRGVARYSAAFTPPTREFANQGLSPTLTGYLAGDLRTATNAAGQTIQYTAYDSSGRVRQMIDSKGVTTDITYTPRGAIKTVAVTPSGGVPRVSTYAYDDAGQLSSVMQADGTNLSYSYDAAHRLTGITDSRGNSITYTRDASGNRIGEDIKDPGGILRRSIARSFDALDRVQQVTGAAE